MRILVEYAARDAPAGRQFDDEIAPVPVSFTSPNGAKPKKHDIIFKTDEGPRADTSLGALAKLKPAFHAKGAVTADVLDGYVTLSGQVRHYFQRQAAHHAVSNVEGVLGIDNRVTLSSDPMPSDVADRIQKAFRRNAIIDDSLITVTNVGHTIQLNGVVNSWAALDAAEDTAWQAPGVMQVVDDLKVVP